MTTIKPEHLKKFMRLCAGLNKLMDDIHDYCPDAEYYLANDNFHLLKGPSHTGLGLAHRENSVVCRLIRTASGGDW